MIILRTIIVISSSRWLNAWIGLEINLISVIPIILRKNNYRFTSSSIKYFLVQAIASIFIIFIFVLNYKIYIVETINLNNEILIISLAIKSGVPPLHFWLPQVVESCNIIQNILILSWQKIAPLTLFSYVVSEIVFLLIFIRSLIGRIGGFNQNSLKKILVYSSIAHISWILFSIILSKRIWVSYFIIYNIRLIFLCILMEKIRVIKISDLSGTKIKSNTKYIFIITILSMAGIPPFLGFFGKILVIINIVFRVKMFLMLSVILLASLISLYFYLKVSMSAFMISEKKIFFKKNFIEKSNIVLIIIVINLIGPIMVYLT